MNKQHDPRRLRVAYGCTALGLTVVSIVLRCINFFCYFDSDIGYFQSGAPLPIIANALLAVSAILLAATGILLFRKSELVPAHTPSPALRIASGVSAVGFFYLAATDVVSGASVWSGILGLGACLFFILNITKSGTPLVHVLSGLCVIVRLLGMLATSYFDVTVQMNSPEKLTLHLACIFGMLMLVSDLRTVVANTRPPMFALSFACGVLFLGSASIPTVAAALGNALTHGSWMNETYALAALFVYAVVRFFDFLLFPVPKSALPAEEPTQEEASETAEETASTESPQEAEEPKESENSEASPEQES